MSVPLWILLMLATIQLPSLPTTQDLEKPHAFPVRTRNTSYSRYHHDYPAADIFCRPGSFFVAPIGGVVDFVSLRDEWEPKTDRPETRGGLSVAIIGDDGWRYYGSHLQSVATGVRAGTRVTIGQLLGYTGSSGNARFTSPHLHFGISRSTGPLDWKVRRGEISPYKYLKLWAAAERRDSLRLAAPH